MRKWSNENMEGLTAILNGRRQRKTNYLTSFDNIADELTILLAFKVGILNIKEYHLIRQKFDIDVKMAKDVLAIYKQNWSKRNDMEKRADQSVFLSYLAIIDDLNIETIGVFEDVCRIQTSIKDGNWLRRRNMRTDLRSVEKVFKYCTMARCLVKSRNISEMFRKSLLILVRSVINIDKDSFKFALKSNLLPFKLALCSMQDDSLKVQKEFVEALSMILVDNELLNCSKDNNESDLNDFSSSIVEAMNDESGWLSFSNTTLLGCEFSDSNLSNLDFSNTIINNCNFNSSNMTGIKLRGAIISNSCFEASHIDMESLVGARFNGVDLTKSLFYAKSDNRVVGLAKGEKSVRTGMIVWDKNNSGSPSINIDNKEIEIVFITKWRGKEPKLREIEQKLNENEISAVTYCIKPRNKNITQQINTTKFLSEMSSIVAVDKSVVKILQSNSKKLVMKEINGGIDGLINEYRSGGLKRVGILIDI